MLFNSIVYGPIHSRRLGISLGINVMPTLQKLCSFNCIYCECGLNEPWQERPQLPTADEVSKALDSVRAENIDVITFSGNGEPTMHPDFEAIIQTVRDWRNVRYPNAQICVLSNATQLGRKDVVRGLMMADKRILKLDSAIDETMHAIDQPERKSLTVDEIMNGLRQFDGNFTLQTCFLRGTVEERCVDNTTEAEISAWIEAVKTLHPAEVMIYVIDRKTPYDTLEKIGRDEMERIADHVRKINIPIIVSA